MFAQILQYHNSALLIAMLLYLKVQIVKCKLKILFFNYFLRLAKKLYFVFWLLIACITRLCSSKI
ncbi:TPA: hypothetical protein DEF17_07280 [bacterium]|nr:hypothetical protein [bacterium]